LLKWQQKVLQGDKSLIKIYGREAASQIDVDATEEEGKRGLGALIANGPYNTRVTKTICGNYTKGKSLSEFPCPSFLDITILCKIKRIWIL